MATNAGSAGLTNSTVLSSLNLLLLLTLAGTSSMPAPEERAGWLGSARHEIPDGPLNRAPSISEPSRQGVHLRYPTQKMREGIGGTTVVQVELDDQGLPLAWSIRLSSGDRMLDRAAEQYLRELEYQPAIRDKLPVPAMLWVPIDFTPADIRIADGTREPPQRIPLRTDFDCSGPLETAEADLCEAGALAEAEAKFADARAQVLVASREPALRAMVLDGHTSWRADRNGRCGADANCLVRETLERVRYVSVLAGWRP